MDISEFIKLLARGEDQQLEFKKAVSSDIGEEIVAFANSDGGIILIGVDDDRNIVGCDIEKAKKKISSFLSSITPPVKVKFDKVTIDNKDILVVEVSKSNSIVTIGGVAFIRIGNSKRLMSIQEILSIGAEYTIIPIDSIHTSIPAREMRRDIWRWFTRRRLEKGLREVKDLKRKLGVVKVVNDEEYLTLAGALFFHERPQDIFPHTYVRIIKGDVWIRIDGPIWRQVEETVKYVEREIPRISAISGVERMDVPWLPMEVLREAVVNALVHRNYSIFSEVFVEITGNEVVIRNPGSFPPGVTPENPLPIPRNPVLYELMFQAGYVEKQGGGIEMMKSKCREIGIEMSYELMPNFTKLTFKLSTDKLLNQIERKIYSLLNGVNTATQIAQKVGLSKPTVIKILKKLEAMGLVTQKGKGPKTRWVRK